MEYSSHSLNNQTRELPNTITVLLVGVAVYIISILLLQWAWNLVIPSVFNLPKITFIQSWLMTVITGTLFGSYTVVNRCI